MADLISICWDDGVKKMLSMKTLRVAIVTMGSALLLGPGLAVAEDIQLDGTMAAAPSPLHYATETLPTASSMGRYDITFPLNELDLHVKPRRRIDEAEDVYLRLDLAGAVIGTTAPEIVTGAADQQDGTITTSSATATVSSGGPGSGFVVIEVGAVTLGNTVGVQLADAALNSNSGSVSATITSYSNPDDALDERGRTGAFGGSTTIVRLVSGVNTIIKAAPSAATASVSTGFRRFAGAFSHPGGGQATLGWLGVEENIVDANNNPNMLPITYHSAGTELADNDIISDTGMIGFNVMGNLDIGAFSTNLEPAEFNRTTLEGSVGCTANAAETVDRGTLVDAESMMLIGEEGERPSGAESASTGLLAEGLYVLCVNVDVMGPGTSMMAIPEGMYTATAHIKENNNALTPLQMVGEEGAVGAIERDGASVEIPYLTTSAKHNQRLVIVNRGSAPVAITQIDFTSEAGTEVELMATVQAAMDAGLLAVPGNSSFVARMDETLNITGGSRRTAATISFAGVSGALSVATTQINLADSSTDTVVYDID
jgi:hypothetical protein